MSWSQCRALQGKPTELFFRWARLVVKCARARDIVRGMRKADAGGLAEPMVDLDVILAQICDDVDDLGVYVEDIENWLREERGEHEL